MSFSVALATFQMFNRQMQLVATIMYSSDIEHLQPHQHSIAKWLRLAFPNMSNYEQQTSQEPRTWKRCIKLKQKTFSGNIFDIEKTKIYFKFSEYFYQIGFIKLQDIIKIKSTRLSKIELSIGGWNEYSLKYNECAEEHTKEFFL